MAFFWLWSSKLATKESKFFFVCSSVLLFAHATTVDIVRTRVLLLLKSSIVLFTKIRGAYNQLSSYNGHCSYQPGRQITLKINSLSFLMSPKCITILYRSLPIQPIQSQDIARSYSTLLNFKPPPDHEEPSNHWKLRQLHPYQESCIEPYWIWSQKVFCSA